MEEKAVPEEVVLKVFKTTLSEFKNRDKYIKDDYRFKDRFKLKPRSEDMKLAFYQVLDMMQQLYWECNLVHDDMSEYYMLWHDRKVWVIDVSQSVEPTHPHGLEFLFRKCRNVSTGSDGVKVVPFVLNCLTPFCLSLIQYGSKFFDKAGVADVMNVYDLFNAVSGLQIHGDNEADFLAQIEALEKMNEDHVQKRSKKTFPTSDDGPPLLKKNSEDI